MAAAPMEPFDVPAQAIDPSDPEALRAALQGNLFRPHPTPASALVWSSS